VQEQSEMDEIRPTPDRRTLIRDILVLQLKLVADGIRDFILVPVSLVVGIISLAKSGEEGGNAFYELLRTGRRSERWINLFGAADRVYGPSGHDDGFPAEDIDEMVNRVESFVVAEYAKGGVTRQAKDQLDRALDSLHRIASRQRGGQSK
jgi:hypothetical protein